jgi:predicted DNA-binding transcriptional regulator AlpA
MAEVLGDPPQSLAQPKEIAEFLGLTEQQLAQMRYLGTGPKFVKVTGRTVRYRWTSVNEWVQAQERTQT